MLQILKRFFDSIQQHASLGHRMMEVGCNTALDLKTIGFVLGVITNVCWLMLMRTAQTLNCLCLRKKGGKDCDSTSSYTWLPTNLQNVAK